MPPLPRRGALALAAGPAIPALLARAQGTAGDANWPSRPVRYINPYPSGGPTNTLSRIWCARMSEIAGQQFVLQKRGGSGGNVGVDAVAKSAPDGYTLGLGCIASHAIAPTLYRSLPFGEGLGLSFEPLTAAQSGGGQPGGPSTLGAGADPW